MKILMAPTAFDTDKDPPFHDDLRATFPQVTIVPVATAEEQKREIRDADAYYGLLTRDVFLAAERLRWLHFPGTGIDYLYGIPELIEDDVVLTNARGSHAPPMADHVFGMMVSLAHHLGQQRDDQRAHIWDPGKYTGRVVELSGRTIGILALGDIGLAVAQRARGFGMTVYGAVRDPERTRSRHGGATPPHIDELWPIDRLDEMLGLCDWFIVTAPLTGESRGMIDRSRLGLLKEGAYVIVISRGGIVDEDALMEGLRSGRIAGAGIDSPAEDPLPEDSPLWDVQNLVLSPHSSALTPEMFNERRLIFKENLRRFLANEPFLYVCDKRAGF